MGIKISSQKDLLFEDIVLYSLVAGVDVLYDLIINVLMNYKLLVLPHEPLGHDYQFGIIQLIILIFCFIQIVRKAGQYKYLA